MLVETDNDSELSYTQRKIYHFNPLTSDDGLSDSDIICTINIPLIVRHFHLLHYCWYSS